MKWTSRRNEIYSRMVGDEMTNGQVVKAHVVMVALGICAIAAETSIAISIIALAVAAVTVAFR